MSDQSSTSSSSSSSVSLVLSRTTLLSGGLNDCYNVNDDTCEGGIALINAYLRQYSDNVGDIGNIVINRMDYQSVFVQMHPLDWNVNRYIMRDYFGYDTYWINPSLLGQHIDDSPISVRDLSDLQTPDYKPLLHGNIVAGTTNSWSQYIKNIHFDQTTGLAIIIIQGQFISTFGIWSLPPADAAKALLTYVHKENKANGCFPGEATPYDMFLQSENRIKFVDSNNGNVDGETEVPQKCWVPVVMKLGGGFFEEEVLHELVDFEYSPAVLVNVQSHVEKYEQPQQIGSNGMWVVSYEDSASIMRQIRISLTDNNLGVSNVTILEHDLKQIPNTTRDDQQLIDDIEFLRQQADKAKANDPIKGLSLEMPIARIDGYRACFGGECPIGNLFTDALRWYTSSDFAFIQSGGVRGIGWPEGPVQVSDIWSSLPFANTQCTGLISGVTVFKLFEQSTREAKFVSERVQDGDRLFQVSGLRYAYNTELEAPRLVKLEILDKELGEYVPVERLKFYTFATSSWMCSGFHPFPSILSDELTIEGEEPKMIGDQLLQNIVGEFLQFTHMTEPYDTSIQGRLTNDTSTTEILDYVQYEESCTSTTYWVEKFQSCLDCPTTNNVNLATSEAEFAGISGVDEVFTSTADIINGEEFPVTVALKSMPDWATIVSDRAETDGTRQRITIEPGEGVFFDYAVTAKDLEAGVATGALSFAVLDGGNFPGCVGRDLVLEISQKVSNRPVLSQAGHIRIVGYSMAAIVTLSCLAFAFWVYTRREKKAVRMMQPTFLLAICFGVFIIGMSILPRSLQGFENMSEIGTDMVCMANAWLLSMGFCLVMSAILAKLWRINKVVDTARAFRRTNVTVKSAILNFSVQFVVNFILMLVWTLVDPLTYDIHVVQNESWRQYGTCTNMEGPGWIFMGLTIGINFCILLLAVYQAYKARNLGEEYSESAGLGLAIFSWLQLLIVVVPVLFLIEEDNIHPRYFLSVSLIFAGCMSMLLFIFVPLIMKVRRSEMPESQRRSEFGNFRLSSAKFLMKSFRSQKHYASAPPTALRPEMASAPADVANQPRSRSMMTTMEATESPDDPDSTENHRDVGDSDQKAVAVKPFSGKSRYASAPPTAFPSDKVDSAQAGEKEEVNKILARGEQPLVSESCQNISSLDANKIQPTSIEMPEPEDSDDADDDKERTDPEV